MKTAVVDRRVQYTRRALTDALITLMHKNHISKISVKELCEIAGINRSTFYAHFHNQYDLLAYVETEALDDLKTRLLADGEPASHNMVKILEYAQEHADLFLVLLEKSDGVFRQQIMELAHLVDLQMSDHHDIAEEESMEYMYLFAVSGALGALSHWLEKSTRLSPSEMSDLLMRMIHHGIQERP